MNGTVAQVLTADPRTSATTPAHARPSASSAARAPPASRGPPGSGRGRDRRARPGPTQPRDGAGHPGHQRHPSRGFPGSRRPPLRSVVLFQRHVTPRCPPPNRSTDGFEGAGVAGRTVAVDISVAAIEVTASDRAPPRALLIAAKRGLVRQVGARFGALALPRG